MVSTRLGSIAPRLPDDLSDCVGNEISRVPAGEPGGCNGLAYYRWHGSPRIYYSDYDEVALAALGRRLDAHRQQGVTTWCILDNTALGAALGNALALGK